MEVLIPHFADFIFSQRLTRMPFGTGSATLGGTGAVDAALQRRRLGDRSSLLSQVSPAAPTSGAQSGMAAPIAPPSPAMPRGAQAPGGQRPPSPPPVETEIIVKALTQRLAALSKMEMPPTPPTQSRPPAPGPQI